MPRLTEYTKYDDAQKYFSKEALWQLFDGNKNELNISYECLDRHPRINTAVRICYEKNPSRSISFGESITISYVVQPQPFFARRRHLQSVYHFSCNCSRCRREEDEFATIGATTLADVEHAAMPLDVPCSAVHAPHTPVGLSASFCGHRRHLPLSLRARPAPT